jgi:branched-subunit amino acid aminotransferase/4-amino-4-deoxychorismate lyase
VPLQAVHIEIDGSAPTTEDLRARALENYGHFTAMQVRGGRVRGLGLHLARLDGANRELFGPGLDGGLVRAHLRHALGTNHPDASVRVYVTRPEPDRPVSIMVTVRPPDGLPDGPRSLQTVPYQRVLAHIKRIGDFGQAYYGRLAERNGFGEALLTDGLEAISEAGTSNIGFFDGTSVIWPDAPMLAGITMQLLEPRLPSAGLPVRRAPVRLADLSTFAAAFVTSSRGIAPVGRVDELPMALEPGLTKTLTQVYDAVPWDEI